MIITTDRINEQIKMLTIIKENSKSIPAKRQKIMIDGVSKQSLDYVIDSTIEMLKEF